MARHFFEYMCSNTNAWVKSFRSCGAGFSSFVLGAERRKGQTVREAGVGDVKGQVSKSVPRSIVLYMEARCSRPPEIGEKKYLQYRDGHLM